MKNSIKQLLIIGLIIIVAGLLSGFFYVNKGSKYQNKNLGIEFIYPKGWHEASQDELAKINRLKTDELKNQIAIINNKQKQSYFSIITQSVEHGKKFDRDGTIKTMDTQLIEKYSSFKKIKGKKIKFLGFEAIEYEIEYGSSRVKWHDRQIIILANNKVYRLTATSKSDTYSKYKEDFNQIFKTFKFL